jgi:hypothetical protein
MKFPCLASAISTSDAHHSFLWGVVKGEDYLLLKPKKKKIGNFKNRVRTATTELDNRLLQNVWHEVKYRLDAGRATGGTPELEQSKKPLESLIIIIVCV